MAHPDRPDRSVRGAPPVSSDNKDNLERPGLEDLEAQELQDHQDRLADSEPLVHLAFPEVLDLLDGLEIPELQVCRFTLSLCERERQ